MTSITVAPFDLGLREGFRSSNQHITRRRGFTIRIDTGDAVGLGEATPLDGWTESYEECRKALSAWEESSVDHPAQLELPTPPAARHAVQLGVMDHAARIETRSLGAYVSIDDEVDPTIPVHATIDNLEIESCVRASERTIEDGFSAIKCKVGGRSVDREIERLDAVRDAVGPDVTLHLDANRAWSQSEVEHLWPRLEDLGIEYVEEPLQGPTPSALASIDTDEVGVGIDESLLDSAIDQCLPVADYVILKPMALGGIDKALDLGMRALAHDAIPVVSGTLDAAIARVAGAHLAAALPTAQPAGLATGNRLTDDIVRDPLSIEDGTATLPEGCGLGLSDSEEATR